MRTKCPIDMKQTGIGKKNFIRLSIYAKKSDFDLCPVPPAFAITPHILPPGPGLCALLSYDN